MQMILQVGIVEYFIGKLKGNFHLKETFLLLTLLNTMFYRRLVFGDIFGSSKLNADARLIFYLFRWFCYTLEQHLIY